MSGKMVYRVRQIDSRGVAIISEVKDGETNVGKVKETRDGKIVLGGTDSFWLVTGEKKEQKLVRQDPAAPAFASLTSPTATRIRGSSIFDLPKIKNDYDSPSRVDTVSFATATRLNVGYSPPENSASDLLAALSSGTLHVPLENTLSAIEVRPGQWITSGFEALSPGRYGLGQSSLRSVTTTMLDGRPEIIRLAQDIIVFLSPPKWGESRKVDLRPEEEIFRSAEEWLARSMTAVNLSNAVGIANPAELLRVLAASLVSEEEKVDLEAVAGILARRSDLLDVLPRILWQEPAFKEKIAAFEEAEKARLRIELEDRLRVETAADIARLASIRSDIADAEARLAGFSHREVLLRSETEKHDDELRRRIESVAGQIRNESARETNRIREEFGRLKEEITQIAQTVPSPVQSPPETQGDDQPSAPARRFASEEQKQKTVEELSLATGLPIAEIAAIVAACNDVVPVVVGSGATTVAIDIATAISGDCAAIVFCDPTKISLTDLLSDERSGLKAAIEMATSNPDVLGAVAMCGITNGPCEYWLPDLLEMRRVGRLPRNLALIASAGIDGMRVSVPNSVLRHLFPLEATKVARAGSAKFEGLWPMVDLSHDRLREAAECLVDAGLEGSTLQYAARVLARTPSWMKVAAVRDVFLRQIKWLEAVDQASEHDYRKYFQNLES